MRSTHAAAPRAVAMRLAGEDDLLGVVDHLAALWRRDRHLDDLLDAGLRVEASAAYAQAAAAFQQAGGSSAAFDACQRGLEAAPGSALVHVELARLYLARGWRDRAVDKLMLLDRLMLVAEDADGHAAAMELARATLADEPRVATWLAAATAEEGPTASD